MKEKLFKKGIARRLFTVILAVTLCFACMPQHTVFAYSELPTKINGLTTVWNIGTPKLLNPSIKCQHDQVFLWEQSGQLKHYTDPSDARSGNVIQLTDITAGTYNVCTKGCTLTLSVPPHIHDWQYTVGTGSDANKITATCTAEDHTGDPVTLTLTASNANYSGSAYEGASLGDTSAWTTAGLTVPTIKYVGKAPTTYEESETAPTEVGTYTAKITVDSETASADFEIKALPTWADVYEMISGIYDHTTYGNDDILIINADGIRNNSLVFGTDDVLTNIKVESVNDESIVIKSEYQGVDITDTVTLNNGTVTEIAHDKNGLSETYIPHSKHNWKYGKCKVCEKVCDHNGSTTGICTICEVPIDAPKLTCENEDHQSHFYIDKVDDQFVWYYNYSGKECNKYWRLDKNWFVGRYTGCEVGAWYYEKGSTGGLCKAAHTHEGVKQNGQAATCTADGWKDYYKCSCDKLYADSACTTEIEDLAAWKVGDGKISAKGHTEVKVDAKAATCTEKGLTEGKKCSVCGDTLVAQKEVAAKGHTWDAGVVTTEATTEKEGVKTYTCTVCKETKTEAVAKLEKKEESKPVEAAYKTRSQKSTITVPTTYEKKGVTYKVTSIKENAFHGSYVKKVDLPSSIKKINSKAFKNDNKLRSVKINSKKITVSKTAFKGIKKSNLAKIKVTVSKKMSKKDFKALKANLVKQGLKAKNIVRK